MLWARNLQLHYPFENQANDYSGNARHGTVFGSGVYATKPNGGRCLYFDGVGDYVKTPSFGLSGTVVVFAADVRNKYYTGARQTLIGDATGSATVGYIRTVRLASTNDVMWHYADGTSNTAATASNFFASPYNDVWLHLHIVCDYAGKCTYFYRQGVLFATVAMTGTPVFPSSNRARYVGAYDGAGLQPIVDGYLTNVQLWTLATMPPLAAMTANANRLMLGLNPIWSV